METKEVVLLRAYQSNNPGEIVSFEAPHADRLVENKIARHVTDEEIAKVLKTHEDHKETVARESVATVGPRKVKLPSERKHSEKVEKGSGDAPSKKG
jgi:hypothetical protein